MLTDPMSGQATDPMAPKPKTTALQPPQAAQTNPVPTTTGTAPQASSTMTPPKAADTTPSTPLGASDPLAFAQTPAPTGGQSYAQTIASQPVGGANAPVFGQMSGPTDLLGRPIGPSGKYEPFSGPATVFGAGGQVSTFQQPTGTWTNADGSPLAPGTDQFGASTFTGTGMQPMSTNGVPNPATGQPITPPAASGAPSIPTTGGLPGTVARLAGGTPSATPTGGLPGTVAGLASGAPFSTSPTTPGSDLRSQTITANAGLDRVGLAQKLIDNLRAQSEPAYQAEQRALTQNAAANGQTGSGMFRTSLGDAARQHDLDLQNGSLGFLSDALKGSVDDNRFATGVAQQQQGFQEGQQRSAFEQQMAEQQLQEALTNGDFSRALAMLNAGNAGNPSDTALLLSNIFGNQASAASGALSGALQGRQQNQANQNQSDIYAQILKQIYGGQGPSSTIPSQTDVWAE